MGAERNTSAEWHADQADELLRAARGEMAMAAAEIPIVSEFPRDEIISDPVRFIDYGELDRSIRAAQAHALTALALRKVGGR